MTADNFCFYLQNRLIQTSQIGGKWYSDTSQFSIPCLSETNDYSLCASKCVAGQVYQRLTLGRMARANLEEELRVEKTVSSMRADGRMYVISARCYKTFLSVFRTIGFFRE
jgi:hypothetical protein